MKNMRGLSLGLWMIAMPYAALSAQEECYYSSTPIGLYVGGYGGWGYASSAFATQYGTAFYPPEKGGSLLVEADGLLGCNKFGYGGLHVGYEWLDQGGRCSLLTPAVELEGSYYSCTKKGGELINPTTRLAPHRFKVTYPMDVGIVLANAILGFNTEFLSPYLGFGIGAGILSIHKAQASQVDPPEPGVNHYNSRPNSLDWNIAVQAKGGFRYYISDHFRLFVEYRFFYIGSTKQIFGDTQAPGHVMTTDWNVRFKPIYHSAFSIGLDFMI